MTDSTTLHPALWLEAQGAKFCRVAAHNAPGNSPGKRALGENWQDTPLSWADVAPHVKSGGNVGMICGQYSGGLILVDVDENLPAFLETLPHYADYPRIVRDNPDKAKFILRLPPGVEWEGGKKHKRNPQDKHPFLELLCTGNQGVIPPSRHPSGELYRLVNADKPIPTVTPEMLSLDVSLWVDVMRYPATPTEAHQTEPPERQRLPQENGGGLRDAVRDAWTPLKVFEHFGMTANGTKKEHNWTRVLGNGGLFVHENGQSWALPSGGKGWGGDVFDAWHYAATRGETPKCPHDRFYDVLCEMAAAAGIPIPAHHTANTPPPPPTWGDELTQELPGSEAQAAAPASTQLTDMGNATRFAHQHAARVRHVAQWGWLVWDGRRWEIDESGRVMQFAKRTALTLYSEAQDAMQKAQDAAKAAQEKAAANGFDASPELQDLVNAAQAKAKKAGEESDKLLRWALKCQNRDRLEAMLALARSEPQISARPGDFDADPWLLNVQNGILDLRAGVLKPHNPTANISKLAGAAYTPGASCPTWLTFLDRIFKNDKAMIDFIQRAVGYSLTGQTSEQCLFFLYGTGANGKSTFTETLQALMGDYARKTPTDSLMVKTYDGGIPNDIARLAGSRLVSAAELSEGRRLNEALVKDLTGGDLITARYLTREFFEFSPRFKLWIYGNHRPEIRGTDGGIWRRVRLIPFEITIPEREQDKNLTAKLRAELPGILAWAVEGCKTWQREGLTPPATVTQATAEYRQSQDRIGLFISECCVLNPIASAGAGELYSLYKTWTGSPKTAISQYKFAQSMAERGFEKARKAGSGTMIYSGIGILDGAREGLLPPREEL